MRHDEQVRLLRQLMNHLDDDTNVDAGGFRRNPVSVYTDRELAGREWDAFFQGHPQIVGMSGDLAEAGAFLTTEDVGIPILATRGKDGEFRAFLNVCRHRGSMVEDQKCGVTARFTCPFHAWSYDDHGTLVGVPKANHFGEFDRSQHNLVELPTLEKGGFLWVHPQPDGEIDSSKLLGGLEEELDSWGWDRYLPAGTDVYDMGLNWKFAMDTFGETYHFNALHKNTLAHFFYGNSQCYDTFGRNHRMILTQRAIDELRDTPEDTWSITDGAFPVYYFFPNVQVNVGNGTLTVVRAYPDPENPDRSISQIGFYADPDVGDREDRSSTIDDESTRASLEAKIAAAGGNVFGAIIRDEDYTMGESAQRAAHAGAQKTVLFGRNEPALHHYHNTYREALGMELLPLTDS